MQSTFQLAMLIPTTIVVVVWIILAMKYEEKYKDITSSIDPKEYVLSELFYVGFQLMEMFHFNTVRLVWDIEGDVQLDMFALKMTARNELTSLLNLGQKYINEMNYEAAIATFDQAIAIDPKCEQAYLRKADAQCKLEMYDQAILTLQAGKYYVENSSNLTNKQSEITMMQIRENKKNTVVEEVIETESIDAPLVLNYKKIVRYSNTDETEIQLEVVGEGYKNTRFGWNSSNEECFTVSRDGLVTLTGIEGWGTITVTNGKDSAWCEISVVSPDSQDIETEEVCIRYDEEDRYYAVGLEEMDENELNGKLQYIDYIYYSGEFTIPEQLSFKNKDFKINKISASAFRNCEELISVVIPSTVECIETEETYSYFIKEIEGNRNPFRDCASLKEINVDSDNEYYKSIEGVLYTKDGKVLLSYPADKKENIYILPKEVEEIYVEAFSSNDNLEAIYVEEGNNRYKSVDGVLVDTLEHKLLAYPSGNKSDTYEIPKEIESIGYKAFYGSSLKKIECSEKVTVIEDDAFSSCKNLEEIMGMKNVEYISEYLFRDCPNLKKVEGGIGTKRLYIGLDTVRYLNKKNNVVVLGMEDMENLEEISITTSAVPDMQVLTSLGRLDELEIYEDTQSIDFESIGKMANLNSLHIAYIEKLEDFSWLNGMENLRRFEVNVHRFNVDDLSPLQKLINLSSIKISYDFINGSASNFSEKVMDQINELEVVKPSFIIEKGF